MPLPLHSLWILPPRFQAHGRITFRLLRVTAVLVQGLFIGLLLPVSSKAHGASLRCYWARATLGAFGLQRRIEGHLPGRGALLVANHVSWIDVLLLTASTDAVFIAKSEVRQWPFFGWLGARGGTLFLKRQCARSAWAMKNRMAEMLRQGRSIVVFAEGTTTDGSTVLPFRTALLQSAVDAGVPVCPVAISYRVNGLRSEEAAFIDGMDLWDSVLAVAGARRIVASLKVCEALCRFPSIPRGASRKRLAIEARDAIVEATQSLQRDCKAADTELPQHFQQTVRIVAQAASS